MTATPEQRPASRGYRLALSSGGAITIWIDFGAKQVKLEGSAVAVDAAARLIQVLDAPQDPAGRNVRLMPLHPAQLASVQRTASMIRTADSGSAATLPLAALLMQSRSDAPAANRNSPLPLPPLPAVKPDGSPPPAGRGGEKPAEFSDLSRIVNPVQMEVIDGLDVLVLRGSARTRRK